MDIAMNERRVDFHSHMLPAMDDGSASLDESLSMLRKSAADGITDVVLTPHFYARADNPAHFLEKRSRRMAQLAEAVCAQLPEAPRLIPGAEVRYFEGITEMEDLPRMRVGETKCLLVEMPFVPWTERMLGDVIELAGRRELTVILAHIERYPDARRRDVRELLLSHGVLMQANGEAFLGRFRSREMMKLLAEGQIHLLGSDSHNTATRPPNLGEAHAAIAKKLGAVAVEALNRRAVALLEG